MAQRPPQAFYRVQHAKSFTLYDDSRGFEARGHYPDAFEQFVNPFIFENHLDWSARPREATPYISFFDNLYDAVKRAQFHTNKGHKAVFIAEIQPEELAYTTWDLHLAQGESTWEVNLPVWRTPSGETFIATSAIRTHLGVDASLGQVAEWFAVEYVPRRMVDVIWDSRWDMCK